LSNSPDGVGFGARLAAFALDAMLVFVVAGPLFAVLGRNAAPVLFVLAPAIAAVFCWHRYGATPGKIAVGAKIVDARSGAPASPARLLARALAYMILAAPLFLGFAWIAIDRRKQAWHDKIAGTRVIYEE
jgi:uncharacterized RDD family membrane protein YckC